MAKPPDLYQSDAHEREQRILERALRTGGVSSRSVRVVPVEEARFGAGVYASTTGRNVVRALFISRDETLLNPTTQSLDGFVAVSDLFDEVHIVILRAGLAPRHPVLRVAPNVWLYTVAASTWWRTPFAAAKLIRQELSFVGGLRADVVVARDPFESAVAALLVAKEFERPLQLHVLEDYSSERFRRAHRSNWWRRFLPRFTIPRFASVRTASAALSTMLGRRFSVPDLATLPRWYDYDRLLEVKTPPESAQLFPQWSLVLLYKGGLESDSTCYRVLDAVRGLLRNPRVGLIVLGDGPARAACERRAARLGIRAQVHFEAVPPHDDVVYFRRAHMLIMTDLDEESDTSALAAAAIGIPLIVSRTESRAAVFVHGRSALLFRHDSVEELQHRIEELVNDVALRRRLVEEAKELIRQRFRTDQGAYRLTYRASIEHALFAHDQTTTV
jgi:glycosyltransferase involved in cell wall biosynthesis